MTYCQIRDIVARLSLTSRHTIPMCFPFNYFVSLFDYTAINDFTKSELKTEFLLDKGSRKYYPILKVDFH